jgi:penicillin amidase
MTLPSDFPVAQRKIGFEWTDPSCATRIKEVLAEKPRLTLADAMALQNDDYCRKRASPHEAGFAP